MLSYLEFIEEKLITFGGRSYPKFNNVVILAGGSASGKDFQLEKLVGIEGRVLDVDKLKKMTTKLPRFVAKVKKETGYEIDKFDMRKPDNVYKLHEILEDVYDLPDKESKTLFSSILAASEHRKPNLIFNVTLKSIPKLQSISRNVQELGYDKKNIHIVWVVQDVEVAKEQNLDIRRGRIVPEEILINTHEGVALTFKKILDMGDKIKDYLDGDIYLSFNKPVVDTKMKVSDKGGQYMEQANYIKIKKQGERQISSGKLTPKIYNKIKSYTPKIDTW